MDQKTISAGGMISGALIIFCGIIVSPIAIGMLASYPHPIWWVGLILCGASGVMIHGGIQSIRKAKLQEAQAKEELERLKAEVDKIKSTPVTSGVAGVQIPGVQPDTTIRYKEVLAHWTFTADEWKKFLILEKKRRKSSTGAEGVAIVILGTLALMTFRDATFWMAFGVSAVLAVIISWLRWVLTMSSIGSVLPINEVTITDQSVLINDKLNPYRSDNYWLDKIQVLDGDPEVLEITYAWNTRKGKTFDEMRIPIPKGKKEEAQDVIQKILYPQP